MLPKLCAVGALIAAAAITPVAQADRAEPVPLYGLYDTYLDHSRQTFNGRPDASDPSTQSPDSAPTAGTTAASRIGCC